jgi:hypothetical protein
VTASTHYNPYKSILKRAGKRKQPENSATKHKTTYFDDTLIKEETLLLAKL